MKKFCLVFLVLGAHTLVAQNKINYYEYWFDADYSSKITSPVTPAVQFDLITAVNANGLPTGLHTFNIWFRDDSMRFSPVLSQFFQKLDAVGAGNITAYEYWYNDDYVNRINQSVTQQPLVNLNVNFPAVQLSDGLHVLHIRFKDSGNVWSSATSQFFQKLPVMGAGNITAYEYWVDDNYASRVTQNISPQQEFVLNNPAVLNLTDDGLHIFHIRFKDSGGSWSEVASNFFVKQGVPAGVPNRITAFRYWLDNNDTSMVEVPVGTSAATSFILQQINVAHLDTGKHKIHIQFKDTFQLWSAVLTDTFIQLGKPRLDFITPNRGGNTGDVTVQIYGTGFYAGTKVKLTRNGYPDIVIPDSLMTIHNGQRITGTIDLHYKSLGLYNVVVTVPYKNGDTVMIIPNGFSIDSGSAPKPWADIVGFNSIRVNTWQTYSITYGNNGNVDATGVPVWLAVPFDAEIELLFGILKPDYSAIDFDTILPYYETDSVDGVPFHAKVYALIIPRVPPDFTGTLNFKMKVTTAANYNIKAWANPPMYGSPLNWNVGECLTSATETISTILIGVPAVSCIYGGMSLLVTPIVRAYIDKSNVLNSYSEYVTSNLFGLAGTLLDCGLTFVPGGTAAKVLSKISNVAQGINTLSVCANRFLPQDVKHKLVNTVFAFDPNDKVGPIGMGVEQYFSSDNPFTYTINFENVDSATAKVQEVVILDSLDVSKFDLNSFEFGFVRIGQRQIQIPKGIFSYQYDFDLRPEGNDVIVRLNARLNLSNGVLSYTFASLDPETMQPVIDPLAGFLPPNVNKPEGEGAVFFSIRAKSGVPNNTIVKNKAYIYFDSNPPIVTNEWSNQVDNIKPHSHVNLMPNFSYDTVLHVSWSGKDTSSGVQYYDIYYSVNGGDYKIWLLNTLHTSATFNGKMDSTYSFYSIATDSAFNRENTPLLADAATTIVGYVVEIIASEFGSFSVYPNPASTSVNIIGENVSSSTILVSLTNISGQSILQKQVSSIGGVLKWSIDVSELPRGVYGYSIKSEAGITKRGRMVIQ